jgi:hypothetical protein
LAVSYIPQIYERQRQDLLFKLLAPFCSVAGEFTYSTRGISLQCRLKVLSAVQEHEHRLFREISTELETLFHAANPSGLDHVLVPSAHPVCEEESEMQIAELSVDHEVSSLERRAAS